MARRVVDRRCTDGGTRRMCFLPEAVQWCVGVTSRCCALDDGDSADAKALDRVLVDGQAETGAIRHHDLAVFDVVEAVAGEHRARGVPRLQRVQRWWDQRQLLPGR